LAGAGILALHQGDQDVARTRLDAAVAVSRALGDATGTAYGLHFQEMAALYLWDSAATAALAESVALFRAAGDVWGLAVALCSLGIDAIQRGDPAAGSLIGESMALAREQGDAWALARALHYGGEVARSNGDYSRARALYEESMALYRELGHRHGMGRILHNLGYVALHERDPRRAAACFSEALVVLHEDGIGRFLAHCLMGLAGVRNVLAQPEQAVRLAGAAARLVEGTTTAVCPVDRIEWDHHIAGLRARLGNAAFAAAWGAGWALPLDRALAEASAVQAAAPDAVATSGPPDPAGAARLTPRELDVLRLLVSGSTNAEIAVALVIGRRTVTTHVEHIFSKLEAHTRTEAAARASARALC